MQNQYFYLFLVNPDSMQELKPVQLELTSRMIHLLKTVMMMIMITMKKYVYQLIEKNFQPIKRRVTSFFFK